MNTVVRRSRVAAAALTGALALSLAGCGFVNTGGGGAAAPGQPATLTMLVAASQKKGLDAVLPGCQASTGITVEATQMPTDELNQQLRIQLTSGTAPDLFRVSPGNSSPVAAGVLGRSGELADITADWNEQLSPSVRSLVEVDGKVTAYPTSQNAIVLAYNAKTFERLGLQPPTTWSELLDTAEKLKAEGQVPIAAGFANGVALQFPTYSLAGTLVYGPTPDVDEQMAAGTTSFAENAAWREVFTKLQTLSQRGFLTPDSVGTPEDQAMQSLATGKAGMMVMISAALPSAYGYAPGGKDDIKVAALPATDDASQTLVATAPEFVAVNAKSTKIDSAKKLLDCLAQPENVNLYATTLGSIPGLAVEDPQIAEDLAPIEPLLTEERIAPFANYMWPNGATQQRLLRSGQTFITGGLTVDQLAAELDSEYAKGTA